MNYLDTTGRIFDIQRFSVHDGPGIRTIVFLKGCFLRCRWCCNPESQEYAVQEMNMNGTNGINGTNGTKKIVGRDVTVREVMDEVVKDIPYYRRSGGGMTLSGGESLAQPEFAPALLRACKEYGINTAMESTGFADFSVINRYLDHLDYFLMDIKHTDPHKHKQFTTQDNRIILENARRIAESGKTDLTIRVPVIPTFNDTPEEIRSIAEFAASLPGVTKIHLLPYHRLGSDKYTALGREYPMGDIPLIPADHMQHLLDTARRCGLDVQSGG